MRVPDWLVQRANEGIFPLNLADLGDEIDEILEGQDADHDSIVDDDRRNRCCALLRAKQRDIEYLSSLDLHKVIAKHVRASCRRTQATDESVESWVNLDRASAALIGLAEAIESEIRAAWKVRIPSGRGISRFTDELSLHSIDIFHQGLENQIGYPPTHAKFLVSMQKEHNQLPFVGRNRTVDPKMEWNIVMRSDAWNFSGVADQPINSIKGRSCTQPLEKYVEAAREIFEKAHAIDDVLNEEEIAALRLWTGPMHEKYAEALRNPQNSSGPYVTTLHAINSGITKLARIWPLPVSRTVYRGYKNLRLQVLKKDQFNGVGGVEKCVLATTEDFNVAIDYSEDGAFILEIEVGQASRGADVRWLSQFPDQQEILFNALSNVEFVCSPQQRIVHFKDKSTGNRIPGKLLVYQVCVSANLRSKTLKEFISLRKDLHLNLVDVLAQEALRAISKWKTLSSEDLIKRLCEECTKQCDAIRDEAEKAGVEIFNKGTTEYVRLVKDAIMFKSRSKIVIYIALRWFKDRKADPAEVGGLLGWQFQALRDAFKDSDPPMVTTVVLEQEWPVHSLFEDRNLTLGAVHQGDIVCNVAKLLSLNPELKSLKMEVASATAELWESVFNELCPGRPKLRMNGFHLAQYGTIGKLQQLELRSRDHRMATMIAPALLMHPPRALTCLSLYGTPVACAGAESLGRAFTSLQRLKYLDLRSCQIADRGCTGIATKLSALSELEDLTLAHNNVNDDGFNTLASNIRARGLSRLQSVDMRFNPTQLPSLRCDDRCVIKNHIVSKFSNTGKVCCVAWSPGGDQIASVSDTTIIIWDAKTCEQVSTLKGHTQPVMSLAWRPWGDQIVSGGYGAGSAFDTWDNPGEIIIWDAKTGEQVSVLKGHSKGVHSVAWRPGGDQIASASGDKTIIIWDAKTWEQISTLRGHTNRVQSVAWRTGGDQIVSGAFGAGSHWDSTRNQGEIIIWDAKTGEHVSTLKGHHAAVTSVAWRPGGDQIASGSWDNTVIIWDAKSCEQISTLKGHKAEVTIVAWRPKGDQIVSGSADDSIIIWDAKTGQQVSTLKGHTHTVTSVDWRPGGDQIASALNDKTIIIWDATTGQQVSTLKGHKSYVDSVAWCPGGDQIASGSADKTIFIWDSKTGEQVSTLKGHTRTVTDVAWCPGGDQIASGSYDDNIIIWDAKTGEQVSMLKGHTGAVTSVAWRPGGDRIASGSRDKTIIIWDATTGERISTLKGHTNWVNSVDWRPAGDQIVSGGYGLYNTRSWKGEEDPSEIIISGRDAKPGDQVLALQGHTSSSAIMRAGYRSYLDHTKSLKGEKDSGEIIIWDAKTGQQVLTLKGHTSAVMSVAWRPRPGGDQIASGSCDNSIIIWDAKTGEQVSTLKGHSYPVLSVAWRPGGDQIVSGGYCCGNINSWQPEKDTGEIIIWDSKSGGQLWTLKGKTVTSAVTCVTWRPRGDQIASGYRDKTIIIWDVSTLTD